MDFWTWTKFSFAQQAIDLVVIGILALSFNRILKWYKSKYSSKIEFIVKPCLMQGCRLGYGHVMPCWDGTPDPSYKERTGEAQHSNNGKWEWVPNKES